MKAITLTSSGPKLSEMPRPTITSADEVLVAIEAVAICRTDLYIAEGLIQTTDNGLILGHEYMSYRCTEDTFVGLNRSGAFAEAIVVPEKSLFHLEAETPFSVGTFVEPVAAGLGVFEARALKDLTNDLKIAIYGSGRIAKLTQALLASRGVAADVIESVVRQNTYDVIIETQNLSEAFPDLIQSLKPRGTIIVKSRNPGTAALPLLEAIQKQIKLEAVRYYLDEGWSLESFAEAFHLASSSEDKKVWFDLSLT